MLVVVDVATEAKPLEWIGSLAVLVTFMHAQVGFRLSEAEEKRDAKSVHCYAWLRRYFIAKENLWFVYFSLLHAWSALVGVGVFLVYPAWRQFHLYRRGPNRQRLKVGDRIVVAKPLESSPHRAFKHWHGEVQRLGTVDASGAWVQLDTTNDAMPQLFFGFVELERE